MNPAKQTFPFCPPSLLASVLLFSQYASSQVTLQPWVQVFGTVNGQQLGLETPGIFPSTNFPYKAAIYKSGSTGVYELQSQSDTIPQVTHSGTNLHAGDVNGDGWTDIVITRGGGIYDTSTVVIYWGNSVGIDTTAPTRLLGEAVGDGFGSAMCIENLIGDPTPDLVVSAPSYPDGLALQGRVYIFEGGDPFSINPVVVLNGDSSRYTLGVACAAGDVNNDSYNDLAIRGWFQYGSDEERYDYVSIWLGGVSFDTTRDVFLSGGWIASYGLACFDVNGDDVDDLLWTNRDSTVADQVWIHYGRAVLESAPDLVFDDPGVANFGRTITNAGDMNSDGYEDIVVAAPRATITSGFVFVYGAGPEVDAEFDAAVGMSSYSDFGWSVASVGDVSGDGLSDIIVGAPNYPFGEQKGYWGIFLGDSSIVVSDVKEGHDIPQVFHLYQSYPNPFNPATTIRYDLHQRATVFIEVYDALGQHLEVLKDGQQEAGRHEVEFDARQYASGVYFYRLTATMDNGQAYSDTKKLALTK